MSRYTITPTPPNLKPRTAAYDASDVTRRTWGKTVVMYKTQNEFDKQNELTVRGVQNGTPGAQPVPFSLVPYLYEASQSQLYTVPQFTQIVAGIQADYDRKYRVRNTTDFAPTGAVGGIFSVPHIVQGIDFNTNGDRIVCSYDFTNMVYHIYKILYDDPTGTPVIDASGDDFLMKYNANSPYNGYVTILPFTSNDTFTAFYVAGYTAYPWANYPSAPITSPVTDQGFPFIRRYDEDLTRDGSRRFYDPVGGKMTWGAFAYLVSLNSALYATGTNVVTGDFTIDGITWPASNGLSPFVCKMNYDMDILWVTRIKPGTSNSCGSICTALSNGDLIAPITTDQGGNWFAGQQWYIKEGASSEYTIDLSANILLTRLSATTGVVLATTQFNRIGLNYFGSSLGLQTFVDKDDNIFVCINGYMNSSPYPYVNQTINFGNGVIATITNEVVCVIAKFNSNLVAQSAFVMALPTPQNGDVPYRFYNKYVSFDPAGNLNINAAYTTGGYATITVNSIELASTAGYDYNTVSYSLTNDLSTVNWSNIIENIKTDSAGIYGYYRNGGILKVDTLNQQLIKVDERDNDVTVEAAEGITLGPVSGIDKSFLIYYN